MYRKGDSILPVTTNNSILQPHHVETGRWEGALRSAKTLKYRFVRFSARGSLASGSRGSDRPIDGGWSLSSGMQHLFFLTCAPTYQPIVGERQDRERGKRRVRANTGRTWSCAPQAAADGVARSFGEGLRRICRTSRVTAQQQQEHRRRQLLTESKTNWRVQKHLLL